MVGVIMGVEEVVDFFALGQRPKGLLFAGGVHQKGLSAFDQKGVAVRVGRELAEKDFYRADLLGLDHAPPFPLPALPEAVEKFRKSPPPLPSPVKGREFLPY